MQNPTLELPLVASRRNTSLCAAQLFHEKSSFLFDVNILFPIYALT